ncbi:MAG: hypothetical protein ACFFB5_05040 [Promethearchaeota archaeon]
MRKKLRIIPFLTCGLVLVLLIPIKSLPNADIANDDTDDVEMISWDGSDYNYKIGDFKNEIDIVSLSVEAVDNENKIAVTLKCQDTPIIDGSHIYEIWIDFEGGRTMGDMIPGAAWFRVGGITSTTVSSASWYVWKNETGGVSNGVDKPTIDTDSKSLSWKSDISSWDILSNSGNWDIEVWSWTSVDTTSVYKETLTSGVSYWDYYPDEASLWEAPESSNSNAANGTPGLECTISLIAFTLMVVILRKNVCRNMKQVK